MDWETPDGLFQKLYQEFPMVLDVAARADNTKLPLWRETDGLEYNWGDTGSCCWMNPPYGRNVGKWVKKAWEESLKGVQTVCLLPSRTDTKWFHEYIYQNISVEIRFLKGRVKFKGAENGAPFPSMIVIFNPPC